MTSIIKLQFALSAVKSLDRYNREMDEALMSILYGERKEVPRNIGEPLVMGWETGLIGMWLTKPHDFTSRFEDAARLVPQDHDYEIGSYRQEFKAFAKVDTNLGNDDGPRHGPSNSTAPTIPLALCIAALDARLSLAQKEPQ